MNREESPHEKHISFQPHRLPAGGHGVGTMAATQNQRQVKRTARKLAKGAEHAICQLDKMVDNFVEQHIDS